MYRQVAGLRAYSTMLYKYMNDPLRDDDRHAEGVACPLAVLTYFAAKVFHIQHPVSVSLSLFTCSNLRKVAVQGVRKLRAVHANLKHAKNKEEKVLWRGMRNTKVTDRFLDEVLSC